MASRVLLPVAGRLRLAEEGGRTILDVPLGPTPEAQAREFEARTPFPDRILDELAAKVGEAPLVVLDRSILPRLGRLERSCRLVPSEDRARLRDRLWPETGPAEREFYLALARARVEARLSSPEETLITLAREEERVERALRRELEAGRSLVTGASEALRSYATAATGFQSGARAHLGRIQQLLEERARSLIPNLSELLGPRVAARLLARAGGLDHLARMPGARIQLLGARRRPTGRGPRFGLLFHAERMESVPPARQGAYARSLASLAAIAARVDATTRRKVGGELRHRRDRRVEALSGRARRPR